MSRQILGSKLGLDHQLTKPWIFVTINRLVPDIIQRVAVSISVGIDLGTTNSIVGVWKDGSAQIIPNILQSKMTPSVVGLNDVGEIIVGQAAKERLQTHPQITTANFKRYMGTNKTITLGRKEFRAEELSALVIKKLKADAEACLDQEITEAVITVPAYFNDTQRKATKLAGEMAGLKVERLLNEPTAAALAYGLNTQDEAHYLVFDLGGGTFDISIVEYFEGIIQVHASAGDNHLGGEDFTKLIYLDLLEKYCKTANINKERIADKCQQYLKRRAELIKCELSQHDHVQISIQWNSVEYEYQLSLNQYEEMTKELLDRITAPVQKAMRDSRLRVNDLDKIVLVGGATRMPLLRKLVTKIFQRFPGCDLDPDLVVAMGACVQSGLKSKDSALKETVLTDVCPYTLGTEVADERNGVYSAGHFAPIIERNSFVPISRSQVFSTTADRQTEVEVKVFQGESPFTKDNIDLGSFRMKLLNRPVKGTPIEIRFTYDVNGILEVIASQPGTNQKESLIIEENPGLLTKQEIERRLNELSSLKIHPRDKEVNHTTLARAARLYEELLGEERQYIDGLLKQFSAILEAQDDIQIKTARRELEEIMDQFDSREFT